MNGIVRGLLNQRMIVLVVLGVTLMVGVMTAPFDWDTGSLPRSPVPVDALPELGEAQQIIATDWPGQSPRDVEDQITYPITVALLGTPGVRTVRGTSMFGLSIVSAVLEPDVDFYWARSRISEKLAGLASAELPAGVTPTLGPDATALGQVFWYTLEGRDPDGNPAAGWPLHELRSLQDFTIKPALAAAAGIAEVASIGGYVREYQVDVDPDRLRHYGLTLQQVVKVIREANQDIGARTLEINQVEYLVRSVGTVKSLKTLREVVVAAPDGVPVSLSQIGRIQLGPATRRGILDKDGAEVVGGVVVVRYGANAMAAITAVKQMIDKIAGGLPTRTLADGTKSKVTIVPFYDRAGLIDQTLDTLDDALIDQVLVTAIVVLLMLLRLRSSFLIASVLPIGVLSTFGLMKLMEVDANVVALAGIAIAIGTMVDLAVVVVDNVLAHLQRADPAADRKEVVATAVGEVAGAILTAVATTIVSFLPVFALTGEEGQLFSPLAATKTLALTSAAFVAIVILPTLIAMAYPSSVDRMMDRAIGGRLRRSNWWRLIIIFGLAGLAIWGLTSHWRPLGFGEDGAGNMADNLGLVSLFVIVGIGGMWVFRVVYSVLLQTFLEHPLLFAVLPITILVVGMSAWRGADAVVGWLPDSIVAGMKERMPGLEQGYLVDLDEGDFLYMPSTMPHASIGATHAVVADIDRSIAALPEVLHAVGKLGRVDSAIDPAPATMVETLITLKPEFTVAEDGSRTRNWRPEIKTRQDVWDEIVRVSQRPELTSAPMLQPIRTRVVMLQSGMKAPMGIKVQGPDLVTIDKLATDLERVLKKLPKVSPATVIADRAVGKPYLEIYPRRDDMARLGLSMDNVQNTIAIAIGGNALTRTIEGREGYDIRVRYPREMRLSPAAIGDLMVSRPNQPPIPLKQVADIEVIAGPQMIRSEDTFKLGYVTFGGAKDPATGVAYPLGVVVPAVKAGIAAAIEDGSLEIPAGATWRLAGDWERKLQSEETLAFILPLVFLSIAVLLQLQFGRLSTTLMVFTGVAVGVGGGFTTIWLWNQPWFADITLFGANLRDVFHINDGLIVETTALWVGFIALLGIATDDGVVMATYLSQRLEMDKPKSKAELRRSVLTAGMRRIRPCLTTTATTVLALLPVLTSSGKGADVMRPMAVPVFGGMVFELITLFVVPVLFYSWHGLRLPQVSSKENSNDNNEPISTDDEPAHDDHGGEPAAVGV